MWRQIIFICKDTHNYLYVIRIKLKFLYKQRRLLFQAANLCKKVKYIEAILSYLINLTISTTRQRSASSGTDNTRTIVVHKILKSTLVSTGKRHFFLRMIRVNTSISEEILDVKNVVVSSRVRNKLAGVSNSSTTIKTITVSTTTEEEILHSSNNTTVLNSLIVSTLDNTIGSIGSPSSTTHIVSGNLHFNRQTETTHNNVILRDGISFLTNSHTLRDIQSITGAESSNDSRSSGSTIRSNGNVIISKCSLQVSNSLTTSNSKRYSDSTVTNSNCISRSSTVISNDKSVIHGRDSLELISHSQANRQNKLKGFVSIASKLKLKVVLKSRIELSLGHASNSMNSSKLLITVILTEANPILEVQIDGIIDISSRITRSNNQPFFQSRSSKLADSDIFNVSNLNLVSADGFNTTLTIRTIVLEVMSFSNILQCGSMSAIQHIHLTNLIFTKNHNFFEVLVKQLFYAAL